MSENVNVMHSLGGPDACTQRYHSIPGGAGSERDVEKEGKHCNGQRNGSDKVTSKMSSKERMAQNINKHAK